MKSKRGLSGIISVVLIISLVMAAGAMVWVFVENMITGEIESTETCRKARGEVEINNDYTCFNTTDEQLRVAVRVGDVELDGLRIAVSDEGNSKPYEITSQATEMKEVESYPGGGAVSVPGKGEGNVYLIKDLGEYDLDYMRVEISPISDGEQCDSADSVNNVYACNMVN